LSNAAVLPYRVPHEPAVVTVDDVVGGGAVAADGVLERRPRLQLAVTTVPCLKRCHWGPPLTWTGKAYAHVTRTSNPTSVLTTGSPNKSPVSGAFMPGAGFEPARPTGGTTDFKSAAYDRFRHPGAPPSNVRLANASRFRRRSWST